MVRNDAELKSNVHMIVISEGPVAIGAFAESRSLAFFHTILAEDMAACFDHSVLEIAAADSAKRK